MDIINLAVNSVGVNIFETGIFVYVGKYTLANSSHENGCPVLRCPYGVDPDRDKWHETKLVNRHQKGKGLKPRRSGVFYIPGLKPGAI
jgi:hypothetical protein